MEITFLGTGAGIPSKERNVTAIIVDLSAEMNESWLFDCGEATQHQLLRTTIKPRKINKVFITHLHGDHLFGLPGLLSSRSFLGGSDPVTLYGPYGVKQFVETSLQVSGSHLGYDLQFVEFNEPGLVFEDQIIKVDCVKLDHGIQSYGYRIMEKDQPGRLNTEKLRALGIPPGPIYRQIKEQPQTVLENGTVLQRNDFLGEPKKGKTVIIFGDTRYIEEHVDFIQCADLLIHEATFGHDKVDLARNYFHSTTTQAAQLAKHAQVSTLILTHISSRYQGNDEKMLLEEAQAIFGNTMIARDFFTYKL